MWSNFLTSYETIRFLGRTLLHGLQLLNNVLMLQQVLRCFHKINLISNKNLFLHGKKCNAINYKLTAMTHSYNCSVHGVCFIVPLCITGVVMHSRQRQASYVRKLVCLGKQ